MKILNSVQELWDYCAFCPICQKNCRKVIVSVGPEVVFKLKSVEKQDSILKLKCVFKGPHEYFTYNLTINCYSNTVIKEVKVLKPVITIVGEEDEFEEEFGSGELDKANFYIYLQSKCDICTRYSTYSCDIEIPIIEDVISDIQLEQDIVSVDKYNMWLRYSENNMLVAENDKNGIVLPLTHFDFSNSDKVIEKIKLLFLFS